MAYQETSLTEDGSIKDNIQVYNIPKFDGFHKRKHPAVLEDHIDEIEGFSKVLRFSFLRTSHSTHHPRRNATSSW